MPKGAVASVETGYVPSASSRRQAASVGAGASPVGVMPTRARHGTANHSRFSGAEEPMLSDLLSDPLTQSVMASDGVKQMHLLLVIAEVQARLNGA
ncbi:MAG: hypothetical protein ABT940_05030 [Alphaproteobacteria bacterium]